MLTNYLPIVVVFAVAGGLGIALLIIARLIGPSRPNPTKMQPYEAGLEQSAPPRIRFHAQFYRVALLFLVFDIEAAFFYPWAVMFRDLSCKGSLNAAGKCTAGATPFGMLVMVAFLAILLLALVFVWRRKALEWD
ncbi:MAG: NADH-quinone oxidoreductase subunit A [Myxococcales bacterium]|nr:NADH-quinone oxidoreductase subunit A [Myxococcales bacterium]